jgi:hypothetical protein
MNNLILFVISIVIFLMFYYHVNKTKEHFNEDNTEDTGDEIEELIKKHQIGYDDKIIDTQHLFETARDAVKTNNQISLWNPIIDTGLYSVGTAISDNLDMPSQPYTVLEGPELINPEKYEMLYRHGDNIRVINKQIVDVKNEIGVRPPSAFEKIGDNDTAKFNMTKQEIIEHNATKTRIETLQNGEDIYNGHIPAKHTLANKKPITKHGSGLLKQKAILEEYIQIFNQTDPRYHECEMASIGNIKHIIYPVTNENYYITRNTTNRYFHTNGQWQNFPHEAWRYREKPVLNNLTYIKIPPYIIVDIEFYISPTDNPKGGTKIEINKYRTRKGIFKYKVSVDGWSHKVRDIEFVNPGNVDPAEYDGKEVRDKKRYFVRTLLAQQINISDLLGVNMGRKFQITGVRKNEAVLAMWTKELAKLNAKINQANVLIQSRIKEKSNGIFIIWRPIPPKGYRVFGDILIKGHNKPLLTDIKCVPERCSKKTRKWQLSDRKLVLEIESMRYSFYKNPFHITLQMFIEKRVDSRWEWVGDNPEEVEIYRAYPCVPKCEYVDGLVDANKCARNMCSNRKIELDTTILRNSKSDMEAENMILDEIKQQDLLLEQLKKTSKELEMDQNKFDIINKEFNRHEMQHFLKTKGNLHRDTIDKLTKSKNGVAVNINSPGGLDALKALLRDYLLHHANTLKKKQQSDAGTNMGESCTNWTDFKQNHRCKYSDPPCFGCVNPN